MTREIKFRAWLNLQREMLYENIFGAEKFGGRDCEIMQYTGLKDKNGKEIYEGDIVMFPDTESEYVDTGIGLPGTKVAETETNAWGEVVLSDIGQWGLLIKNAQEVIDNGFSSFYEINENFGLDELEIIGNIYENKELLYD